MFVLENLSLVSAIISIVLIVKQNRKCWIFSGFSSLLMIYIFFESKIYFQSFLYVYYVFIAVYGYYIWGKITQNKALTVSRLSLKGHAYYLLSGLVLTSIFYTISKFSNIYFSYPFFDSLLTAMAIVAQYMQAKKILQNFIYWIFINMGTLVMLISAGLFSASAIQIIFTVFAVIGYREWRKELV